MPGGSVSVEFSTNWLFAWDNTAALTWDSALAANRSWDGAYDVGTFTMSASEEFAFSDAGNRNVSLNLQETLALIESRSGRFELNLAEALGFSETLNRAAMYVRTFAESFALTESFAKHYGLNLEETLALIDALRRQCDLVASDVTLFEPGDMTEAQFIEFMATGAAPGYERWRDFVPGDYEYREALIRIILESKNADRGLITGMEHVVDVPDLLDRGSATITDANAGFYVEYNKNYHITPEITLLAKSAAGANPVVAVLTEAATKAGFRAKMRDTITGAYVTGSFTWTAHGY